MRELSRIYFCRKCVRPHSSEEYEESRFCRNCGTFLIGEKRTRISSTSRNGGPTHAEMIADVIEELREPFTTQQIVNAVLEKFSAVRPINSDSLRTDIAGCCVNLSSRYSLPDLPSLLVSVGRGLYRRYDPEKDKDLAFGLDVTKVAFKFDEMTKKIEESEIFEDLEKARKIGGVLYDLFKTKTGFFKDYEMPEYVLPENIEEGTVEHAWYLTYIISVDYQTDAVKLWKNARRTYLNHPEYFDPKNLVSMEVGTLSGILKKLGARYPTNGAKAWKSISATLLKDYEGDPRKMTPEPLTVHEVKRLLKSFPNLRGKKLSNFYIRAMGEKDLFKIKNLDELDIPVDVQVARLTFYTGCLQLMKGSLKGCIHDPPIQPAIENVWREAAKTLGIAPWRLDEPIWTIGSKLCARRDCSPCPVKDLCSRNLDATIKGNKIYWQR